MKLFVYEYITSGALAEQSLPKSLAHEGDEMLSAIIRDCNESPSFSISMIRDIRLAELDVINNNNRHHCHFVSTVDEHQARWQQCLDEAEAVLIIAPETDGILSNLHRQALVKNKVILGCHVPAIETTSNKLTCYQQLKKHDIAVADTYLASDVTNIQFTSDTPYLAKPIDGAGCLDTYLFDTVKELDRYLLALSDIEQEQIIIQPYINGISASLSLLFSDIDVTVLSINEQQIELENNKLTFIACHVNGIIEATFSYAQAYKLARQVQDAIPGLWGLIGIDFIITENSAVIVDINPRVTTAYIGLKSTLQTNPMDLLLQIYEDVQIASSFPIKKQMICLTL